ncbi:DNA adenine methylase [Microvirga splendida]|uniref:DNA adenine methylase n=1 Tax=Microvirga splendida TaxID=2795727 RepID=A0ABS0XXR1_9HYPH|nr:DNA adenine methylase [Microvirga splendida]MBJ6124819.1 DNA adenine methylase [Microvirga splendida]
MKETKKHARPDIYGNTVPWCTRSDVSPLRYPGGKRKLAPFIADVITRAKLDIELFVEPFAGGGAVSISLLEGGYVKSIALADADPLVAAFWRTVFSMKALRLADMIYDVDVTLDEWHRQKSLEPRTELQAAFKCFFLNRTSFSGALMPQTGPIGGRSQSGAYKIDCRFNREKLAERILELQKLSNRVAFVRNESYRKTLRNVRAMRVFRDTPETVLWYLDPPFFAKAERLYSYSFSEEQHDVLAQDVKSIPGHWILSYDDHPEAREKYGKHPGFARVNLQYSARIDAHERLVASEVIVSNIIARLRASGDLQDSGVVIQLPRRRQIPSAGIVRNPMFPRTQVG